MIKSSKYTEAQMAYAIKQLETWSKKVEVVFSSPGKPKDNAYIESFDGSFQNECFTPIDSFHWKM